MPAVKLDLSALRVIPAGSTEKCNLDVLEGEYDIPIEFDTPPIILDIGAHVGAFSLWARERWPGSTIFAYEPHPRLFKALEENLSGTDVVAHQAAVGNAEGKTLLFEGETDLASSSIWKNVNTKNAGGWVKLIHSVNLPECDILKIDTELSEIPILFNYKHLPKCRVVLLEWHSQRDRVDLRKALEANGFAIFEDKEVATDRGLIKAHRPQSRPHLFVAVLAGGGKLFFENEQCISALRRLAPTVGYDVTVSYDPGTGVDRARNRQVARFMESGATHLLMLDNDLEFRPDDVTRMIGANQDFVAGAYPRKQIEWEQVYNAVQAGVKADKLHEHSCSFIYNTIVNNEGGNNAISLEGLGDFVEIEEVGTGFMLIKRCVIERMIAAYGNEMAYVTDYEPRGEIHHMIFACGADPRCEYELAKAALLKAANGDGGSLADAAARFAEVSKTTKTVGRYLTEDYRMCRLWRMLGGKIWMMVDCPLNHIGTMTFSGRINHTLRKVEDAPTKSESTKDQSGSNQQEGNAGGDPVVCHPDVAE